MVSPFFGPDIGEDQKKKGLRRKRSGFSVQNQKTKKGLRGKITGFSEQTRLETKQKEKTRSPQISRVMVSHLSMVSSRMVSSRNGVTRGAPLGYATANTICLTLH